MNLYEEILNQIRSRGRKVEKHNGYAMAQCIYPENHEHGDRTPSLKISEYGYKCFNERCELSKGGSLFDLAERLGLKVSRKNETRNDKAVEYIMKRLRFDSEKEARAFMQRMNIYPGKYYETEGIYIDLFNGDKKFRNFEAGEKRAYKHFGESKKPAFSGLVDVLKHKAVALTEGTFDALTFWRLNIPALSCEGTKYKLKKIKEFLKSVGISIVYFAFDIDNAGQNYLENAVELLLQDGINFYFLEIPEEYKDVNEFIQRDQEGFIKALDDIQNNNLYRWYIKRNYHLLEKGVIGEKMIISKLALFYHKAFDKKTAWDELMGALQEYGINQDDWLEVFEKIDIIEANERKKQRLREELTKAINDLNFYDIDNVIETLKSGLNNYKTIEIKNLKSRRDELIKDDVFDKVINSKYFPGIKLLPSDIFLLTAPTKSGKTTLALNMANDFLDQNKVVLYVTYEIGTKLLFWLFAGLVVNKHWSEVTEEEREEVLNEYGNNLFIEDGLTLDEIIAYVRTLKPDIFIIDYDQMVQTTGRFENEERRVAHIVSSLKDLARENENLCILLSQVNEKDQARYSRTKEFYASVHVHLAKEDNQIVYEVKNSRYSYAGAKNTLKVDWVTRRVETSESLDAYLR